MRARIEAPCLHPPRRHITLNHMLNIGSEPFPELARCQWPVQAMQRTEGKCRFPRLLHYRKVLQDRGHHRRAALMRMVIGLPLVRGRDRVPPSLRLRRVCSLHPRPVNSTS